MESSRVDAVVVCSKNARLPNQLKGNHNSMECGILTAQLTEMREQLEELGEQ